MSKSEELLSRRKVLGMAVGAGGWVLSNSVLAQDTTRVFTPPLTPGPFYPQIKPQDQDVDLTLIKRRSTRAEGQIIHVAGRVLNLKGEPVKAARIEIWQANSHGRYAHTSDPNPASLDPNFQGFAVLHTDNHGRYRFKTIKPAAYPGLIGGKRTPHIHFEVFGKNDRLVTQMFFPDEPLNEQDNILQSVRPSRRDAAIAKLIPTKEVPAAELMFGWDIVLISG
jgi:protocatechuate 3,4-dioxygenase, beta subunit